jgi:transcriptional regulator with XRE-family HTH domain
MTGDQRAAKATDAAVSWGMRVQRRREELEWTQVDVAKNMGVAPQTISKIERDEIVPRLRTMESLAQALGTTLEELFPLSARPMSQPSPGVDVVGVIRSRRSDKQKAS